MKRAYILHHLGLGDHIACNGLYRHLAKNYDELILPVKKHNYDSLKRMLSDVPNINFKTLSQSNLTPEQEMIGYQNIFMKMTELRFGASFGEIIKLGQYKKDFTVTDKCRFDEAFYNQAGYPFRESWNNFFVKRDRNLEKKVFNELCGEGNEGKYIFLHEDPSRKDVINRSLIKDLNKSRIITPCLKKQHTLGSFNDINFFDYRYILENAKEIHCIESSFSIFIDRIQTKAKKYLHIYTRYGQFPPTLKNNWTIYE